MTDSPDVLIIGAGIAGLSVAINAAEMGKSVLLLTKTEEADECNTAQAQGGIVGTAPDDTAQLFSSDIAKAGAGLVNRRALRELVLNAPSLVDDFLVRKCRVDFARKENGQPDLAREGAHSIRRIYHQMDRTGKAIHEGLYRKALEFPNIHIRKKMMAVDLITLCHHSTNLHDRYRRNIALGVYVMDVETGSIFPILAPATVLASGGVGRIYRYTSNPAGATGDGIAMAYNAGLPILNAEYVQFHPTTLSHRDCPNFLISEALRGEGAVLLNRAGERFMERYQPEKMELAPRDEVSRAIYQEMENRGDSHVFLDATHVKINLKRRFPSIYSLCLTAGIDISRDPIPVVPAAHYFCGGVKSNLQGRTELPGLYVLGETACTGLHGANRLASVSLLEGLYSGVTLGTILGKSKRSLSRRYHSVIPEWESPEEDADHMHILNDLSLVQGLMWNYVGISRTRHRLRRALADLEYLNHRINRFYRAARPSRPLIEMRNAILCATVITKASMASQNSRGSHFISG